MKKILYLVLVLLAILSSIFVPIDLVLIWTMTWGMFISDNQALLAAFIGGLLIDLLSAQAFGVHSLALVGATGLVFILLRLALLPPKFIIILGYCLVSICLYHVLIMLLEFSTSPVHMPATAIVIQGTIMVIILWCMHGHFERLYKKPLRLTIS